MNKKTICTWENLGSINRNLTEIRWKGSEKMHNNESLDSIKSVKFFEL